VLVLSAGSYRVGSGHTTILSVRLATAVTALLAEHGGKVPASLTLTPSTGKVWATTVTIRKAPPLFVRNTAARPAR
jgi:hypothetical protein